MGDGLRTRREFVAGAVAVGVAIGGTDGSGQVGGAPQTTAQAGTPGAPPAFGTAAVAGPEVTVETFAEAEKVVQAPLTVKDRAEVAGNWRQSMAALYERRVGPRKVAIPETVVPYSARTPTWTQDRGIASSSYRFSIQGDGPELPKGDAAIAFAPVSLLSQWIYLRKITATRLTEIYLERMRRYDGELRSVITATPELALRQARAADVEIAAGRYKGPLHGIPWGGKDLLDTAGIRTTYGAECFRNRVPTRDAAVVARLHAAGAVMVAKLSMGALALNDVWFGGQTMNPWLREGGLLVEGSSGSSAGPGAAVAAGLVGFAIGSETEGSIVSPTMRCGLAGLRPTFGRVPRTGAMTLCWSLDKLGPMCRSVGDTMAVLEAIAGADAGDISSESRDVSYAPAEPVSGLKVGYFPGWMKEAPATDVDRHALEALRKLGAAAMPVTLPDWPYGSLNLILFAEAAAAFEEITLNHRVDELKVQVPDAWPNSFRQARFLSAVDYVQADRFRRMVAGEMERIFRDVDVLLVPGLRDEMLTISNFTGHPSLTMRAGFVEVTETRSDWAPGSEYSVRKLTGPPRRVPHGVTLVGRPWDEGTIARVGMALERELGVAAEHPAGFGG